MISFIVIGRNEGEKLKRCFESIFITIKHNKFTEYEIIYVDSKSTDNSIVIAQSYKKVKIFLITGFCNAAIGRNIGAKESKGSILFFIDGDMEIEKDFLSNVLDKNMNLNYDFVSGQVVDIVEDIPDKLRYSLKDTANIKITQAALGGIFIIKREIWEAANGMRTKFTTGEESDLGYRLIKMGFSFTYKNHIISKHYTYQNTDLSIISKAIFSKAAFYPRCIFYRNHILNKYMYFGMWKLDKTFVVLIISIFLMLIFPDIWPIFILTYVIAVFLRTIKQSKKSIFKYILYYLMFDILNIIYFFTFFPENKSLKYQKVY